MALTEEQLIHVPGMLSRWVLLGTGARAHYMTSGETGPAVILLHGGFVGASGVAGWRLVATALGAAGFRVYCPDMPAYGLTEDHGAYDYGQAGHVDFLHDFANALCLDRFHLAGNSMGSTNTVHYVVAHPERVISFALVAGGVGDLVTAPPAAVKNFEKPPIPQFDGTEDSMRAALGLIVHRPDSLDDDLVAMRTYCANRNLERSGKLREEWLASVRGEADPNAAARLRTRGRLDELTIPGIYLYGRDDKLSPVEVGYGQEDALPNVQFFYPEDTGHQGQSDQPELFTQVFREFFGEGRISAATARRAGVSSRRPSLDGVVASDDPQET